MSKDLADSFSLNPKDVLGTIGTLLGLLVASIGLLATSQLQKGVFQVLVSIITIIILAFTLTAILSIYASISRNSRLWEWAVGLYGVSWIVFGVGFTGMLLVFAYGPGVFTINIPPIAGSVDAVSLVTFLVGVIAGLISVRRASKGIYELARSINRYTTQLGPRAEVAMRAQREEVAEDEDDVEMAFVRRSIELEKLLRQMTVKLGKSTAGHLPMRMLLNELQKTGTITSEQFERLSALWDVRNRLVHGIDVPKTLVKKSLTLVIILSEELSKVNNTKAH